jgi:hypothetical protein
VADETGMKAPTLFTTMYMHAAPQDAGPASMRRTGAIGRFWHPRTRAMQDRACGLRRIPIPRTRVNNTHEVYLPIRFIADSSALVVERHHRGQISL